MFVFDPAFCPVVSVFDLGPQLGVMAVWLVIIYAIAFRVFRWE